MPGPTLPSKIHVSRHPCVHAKISQLRCKDTGAREVKSLVHDVALNLGVEALATALYTAPTGTTPLGYGYITEDISPTVALITILRSGLGMVEALQSILPNPVPVHHLGLFREPTTLQPVEYYNKLPYHRPTAVQPDPSPVPSIAILLDPLIATGGTASAAIQTLLEWGVGKVVLISVLGSEEGIRRAAKENDEASVEVWVGAVDQFLDEKCMIQPGLGDVGDRLFLTIGK